MISVGQPLYGQIWPAAHISFTSMMMHNVSQGLQIRGNFVAHSYLDLARNCIVETAVNNEDTHVFFVDQDMVIPHDALMQLLKHELPVVGGTYFVKGGNYHPVALEWDAEELSGAKPIDRFKPGLQEVDVIGMGCTLIEIDVFLEMAEHFDDTFWFKMGNQGEDVWFAQRCKELGIKIHMDGDLICGHVGEATFGLAHYMMLRPEPQPSDASSPQG
jgi:hypothetical protein